MLLHRSYAVVDDVYFYLWTGHGMNCNSVVLANVLPGAQPHILVDPGMTSTGMGERPLDALAEAMAADGLRIEDVGLVFGTHSHPDHYQAVDEVVKRTGAAVALSRAEDEFLRGAGGAFFGSFGKGSPTTRPSLLVEDGNLPVDSGSPSGIEVIVAPGHTPGCACLLLKDSGVLVSGDVVFPGSIGRMDFPGGSTSQMKRSIERLSALDIEYILPGHSSPSAPILAGRDNVARNFEMVRMFF